MVTLVSTLAYLLDFIAHGLGGLLTTPKIILGTNVIVPGLNTVPADLGTPTITGYAAKSVAWSAPIWNPALGLAECVGTAVYTWFGPADATGQSIRSVAVVDVTAATVLGSANLPNPVGLFAVSDALILSVIVRSNGSVVIDQIVP